MPHRNILPEFCSSNFCRRDTYPKTIFASHIFRAKIDNVMRVLLGDECALSVRGGFPCRSAPPQLQLHRCAGVNLDSGWFIVRPRGWLRSPVRPATSQPTPGHIQPLWLLRDLVTLFRDCAETSTPVADRRLIAVEDWARNQNQGQRGHWWGHRFQKVLFPPCFPAPVRFPLCPFS